MNLSARAGQTGAEKAVVVRLHLVNASVNVDHHIRPRRRDPSLGDANQVVQPTVAFVIGLKQTIFEGDEPGRQNLVRGLDQGRVYDVRTTGPGMPSSTRIVSVF